MRGLGENISTERKTTKEKEVEDYAFADLRIAATTVAQHLNLNFKA